MKVVNADVLLGGCAAVTITLLLALLGGMVLVVWRVVVLL